MAIRSRLGVREAAATNPPLGAGSVRGHVEEERRILDGPGERTVDDEPVPSVVVGTEWTRGPRCGLSPYRPHQVAGVRIDPPPSDPRPNEARPAATAAAVPPLLPPGDRERVPRVARRAEGLATR